MLAAPDQGAWIHKTQEMDELEWRGLHECRELDFRMDGSRPSHPDYTARGSDREAVEVKSAHHILQARREDKHASK